LAIGVECQKEDGGEYEHVFTILTAENDFVGKIEITDEFKVILNISTFSVNIDSIIESHIGNINVSVIKALIGILGSAIKSTINLVFKRGISLKFIFSMIGVNFIDFEKAYLEPYDEYFIFYCSPKFEISNIDNLFSELGDLTGNIIKTFYDGFSNVVIDSNNQDMHGLNTGSKHTFADKLTNDMLIGFDNNNDSIQYFF